MEKSGSAGGKATLAKHGRDHFRDLGKRGMQALASRYFNGSIPDAMSWLRSRRNEHQIAALVDEKLDRQLAAGAFIASEELPVLCEPDCDPSYWRDRARASKTENEIDLPW